ncbi:MULTISPECIES: YceD family protein [Thiomicrorhabdus]|uniref:Large ribosomal RNA subunit accumulation protein YceD n=1 Tax=Thiomicrorhabdus heinhorstiae TaxID=2748010 RepID=A0ABS0C0A5_9GAMM|nr:MULTISPECIES: YceD family protein [Thiomicrorhabdus]MBF6058521.1 DUF177 domain-containing protein [Thiomicrorhabdus heinhorstiae]
MLNKLPEFIDPLYSVNHNKQFVGRVNQARMQRLKQLVETSDREVDIELSFFYDKALKFPAFVMKLDTELNLICQRSLAPFDFQVNTEVKGVFVESMALVEDLPSDVEVFELDGDKISLVEWVEEELLLAIPMVPTDPEATMDYQNDSAEESLTAETNTSVAQDEPESKPNPFAILQGLKK